jgi:hypothetical protein
MISKILGLAVLAAALSGPASAHHSQGGGGTPTLPAPEINPASAMSALTMLASGLVILRGRRVKK